MAPGRHDLVVRFDYDGGPPGSGADVTLEVDGAAVGSGRIPVTTAYYFSFDETFNVGVDRGTPVVDDYLPVRNRFEGLIHRVRFDLGQVARRGRRRRARPRAPDPPVSGCCSPSRGPGSPSRSTCKCRRGRAPETGVRVTRRFVPGAGRTLGSDDPDHPEEWPVREVDVAPFRIARLRGQQRRVRGVRGGDRAPHRRRALRLVVRLRRASCPTTSHPREASPRPRGGARCTAPTGPTPRGRISGSASAATTRSCTCPAETPRRTPPGAAPGCRPRPSGSTPRGVGWSGEPFPWGAELEPGGEHRMNVWQGTLPGRGHRSGRLARHLPGGRLPGQRPRPAQHHGQRVGVVRGPVVRRPTRARSAAAGPTCATRRTAAATGSRRASRTSPTRARATSASGSPPTREAAQPDAHAGQGHAAQQQDPEHQRQPGGGGRVPSAEPDEADHGAARRQGERQRTAPVRWAARWATRSPAATQRQRRTPPGQQGPFHLVLRVLVGGRGGHRTSTTRRRRPPSAPGPARPGRPSRAAVGAAASRARWPPSAATPTAAPSSPRTTSDDGERRLEAARAVQLDRVEGHPAGQQGQGGADPGEERPLVGEAEAGVGAGAGGVHPGRPLAAARRSSGVLVTVAP